MKEIMDKIGKTKIVFSLKDFEKLKPTTVFAMDIETHGENKKVGDCPYYDGHGVAGVAICNMKGEACYVVVDDGKNYGGVPINDFIAYMNKHWMLRNRICVFHNCKFDLGFLLHRNLNIKDVSIRDTWIISSIRNKCVFSSNKLKDIARDFLNVKTSSEDDITNWLSQEKTEDYGEIPVELIAPYACDDVRYTLLIFFKVNDLEDDEKKSHDLLVRNMIHFIHAEERGMCVHLDALKDLVNRAIDINKNTRKMLIQHLGNVKVDLDDPQSVLKILHSKKLHSEPRSHYGTVQYVLDDEFLLSTKSVLANMYRRFFRRGMFIENFSAKHGRLSNRVWVDKNGDMGIHPYFWPSVHSKGGLPQCKIPDLVDGVVMNDLIRSVFKPRQDYKFVKIKVCDLPALVFATYLKDSNLEAAVKEKRLLPYMSSHSEVDWKACSLWLKMQIDGHGMKVFNRRLSLAGVKFNSSTGHFDIANNIERVLKPNNGEISYGKLKTLIQDKFRESEMFDRVFRRIKLTEDKLWRSFSIIQQSSVGGIIASYLDCFCKLSKVTGTSLVFAHKNEMLFEVPSKDASFEMAAIKLIKQHDLVYPKPIIDVSVQKKMWKETFVDADDLAYKEIIG